MVTLYDGIVTLDDGMITLDDGMVILDDGMVTLDDGMVTLDDGMVSVRQTNSPRLTICQAILHMIHGGWGEPPSTRQLMSKPVYTATASGRRRYFSFSLEVKHVFITSKQRCDLIPCKPDISRLVGSKQWYRDISESVIYRATVMNPNQAPFTSALWAIMGLFHV